MKLNHKNDPFEVYLGYLESQSVSLLNIVSKSRVSLRIYSTYKKRRYVTCAIIPQMKWEFHFDSYLLDADTVYTHFYSLSLSLSLPVNSFKIIFFFFVPKILAGDKECH